MQISPKGREFMFRLPSHDLNRAIENSSAKDSKKSQIRLFDREPLDLLE